VAIRISEDLTTIEGQFNLRVGKIVERSTRQVSSKKHVDPLVEGTVPVYDELDEAWWVVYTYDDADRDAEPLVHTDRKSDTIKLLRALIDEANQAIAVLEEM